MIAYVVVAVALALLWLDPVRRYMAGFSLLRPIRRGPVAPRPQLDESLLATETTANLSCPQHASYSVHIFSKEPIEQYIENFLSAEERAHLLEIR